ncbi:MAG: alkaline phosphatase family protein [Photobacterium frigidiphilum]|uniref:alkaline phosphatase family protein n=1 Tax=Photobacterium frigidiphilum TaxID=264736 RepID=UPI003001F0B8
MVKFAYRHCVELTLASKNPRKPYRLMLSAALMSSCMLSPSAQADIGSTPIVGAFYNSTQIIKEKIYSGINKTAVTTRDATLFTIGGVTLDAYILTLPLDAKVKARVISRLTNPLYSIQLGHFLYMFYDRYTGLENTDIFKDYLQTVYTEQALKQYEHSLLNYDELDINPTATSDNTAKNAGLSFNNQFIASMVTIYDTLFNNDEWLLGNNLPEHYTYLTKSPEDLKLINTIQALVIELMTQYSQSIEDGEIKAAIMAIIDDAKPENAHKPNNKAQAITITLVDFVRLNVLKGYRQYSLERHRIDAFNRWMENTFNQNPSELIQFLQSQNNKRYGVQITVDGLQQGMINALAEKSSPTQSYNPFIDHAYATHLNAIKYKPTHEETIQPEHQQQLDYLTSLATNNSSSTNDAHYLPFFKSLYQNYSRSIAKSGISSTPTISVRNLPIIMTGANVAGNGGTGIPNFHFVDREIDRAYYFFGNDALQLDRLIEDNHVQTMFDRLNYLKTLNCNAQYDWNAQVSYDGLINLAVGEAIRDFGEQRCLRELTNRAEVENELKAARSALIKQISNYQDISLWTPLTRITKKKHIHEQIAQLAQRDEQGMPDYTLIYNPWPDHFAHFTGPFSDEVIAPTGELNRLDYWLAQFTQTYKDAGIYDQTLWGMAGDHGLTPVFYALNPEKQVLEQLEKDYGISLKIEKISSDEGEGPKITNALNYPTNKGIDVVVASTAGGNFMMDFFNSTQGWSFQPHYKELTQWRPLDSTVKGKPIDMISEISNRLSETLDYLVVRESNCNLTRCTLRLVAHRGGKRIDESIQREGEHAFYSSFDNSNIPQLLDIESTNPYSRALTPQEHYEKQKLIKMCITDAQENDVDTWCNQKQWRQLTSMTPRADSVNQLAHLYDEDRAGTINLFPKEGIGYNTIVPGRHAGEHYLEKDAFIGFWGTPVGNGEQLKSVANGSLAPTIYQYITRESVVVGENGWGFPSVLPELAIKP